MDVKLSKLLMLKEHARTQFIFLIDVSSQTLTLNLGGGSLGEMILNTSTLHLGLETIPSK